MKSDLSFHCAACRGLAPVTSDQGSYGKTGAPDASAGGLHGKLCARHLNPRWRQRGVRRRCDLHGDLPREPPACTCAARTPPPPRCGESYKGAPPAGCPNRKRVFSERMLAPLHSSVREESFP